MEDVVIKTYEPTYRLKPYDEKKFSPSAVRAVCEEIVNATLQGKSWNGDEEAVWSVDMTEQIKAKVVAMDFARYKIVVQIVLGQNKNQGVRVASRCLWDTETDNYASYTFSNDAMWCTAMVFGCCTYFISCIFVSVFQYNTISNPSLSLFYSISFPLFFVDTE
jgi:hypothetical protein